MTQRTQKIQVFLYPLFYDTGYSYSRGQCKRVLYDSLFNSTQNLVTFTPLLQNAVSLVLSKSLKNGHTFASMVQIFNEGAFKLCYVLSMSRMIRLVLFFTADLLWNASCANNPCHLIMHC